MKDREAWHVAVHRVTKSWRQRRRLGEQQAENVNYHVATESRSLLEDSRIDEEGVGQEPENVKGCEDTLEGWWVCVLSCGDGFTDVHYVKLIKCIL